MLIFRAAHRPIVRAVRRPNQSRCQPQAEFPSRVAISEWEGLDMAAMLLAETFVCLHSEVYVGLLRRLSGSNGMGMHLFLEHIPYRCRRRPNLITAQHCTGRRSFDLHLQHTPKVFS